LEIGSHTTIEILLDSFIKAAFIFKNQESDKSMPYKYKRILELMKSQKPRKNWSLHHSYMHVLDFISGMTDNYATHIARQLRGMAD
jgi:dGTPase